MLKKLFPLVKNATNVKSIKVAPKFTRTYSSYQEKKSFWSLVFKLWKNVATRYAMIASGVIIVSYAGYKITQFFSSLTFEEVGRWAFWAGFWSAMILVMFFSLFKNQYTYKTNKVFQEAYHRIKSNPQIIEQLGEPVEMGKFKTYGYEFRQGELSNVDSNPTTWFWNIFKKITNIGKNHNLQILFQINGAKRMGMVSGEVSKLPGFNVGNDIVFKSLSCDVFHKDQEKKPGTKMRVILEGTEEDVVRDKTNIKF